MTDMTMIVILSKLLLLYHSLLYTSGNQFFKFFIRQKGTVQLRKNCLVLPHKEFSKRENVDRGGGEAREDSKIVWIRSRSSNC